MKDPPASATMRGEDDSHGSSSLPPASIATTVDESTGLDEVGFLFEGHQPSQTKNFSWYTKSKSNSKGARMINVALEVADDDPGAVISGHYLWPAAELLSEYLVHEQADRRPVSVVELGAGCALASLTALQLWQQSLQCVLVTDHDPGTLDRARSNHESTLEALLDQSLSEDDLLGAINNVASIPVLLEPLEWGAPSSVVEDLLHLLRDHTTAPTTGFDVVLGTDLIYCIEVVSPLLECAARLLAKNTEQNDAPPVFFLSQSFAYEPATEDEIDRVCAKLGLARTILVEDAKKDQSAGAAFSRIQAFQFAAL